MFNRIWAATALLALAACTTTKAPVAEKNAVTVNLDTVEVVVSRENPYRASATRENDLVHNKLEVSFDYTKQYLSGKATLTLKPHFYPQNSLVLDAKQFNIYKVDLIRPDNFHIPLSFTYDSLQLKIQLDRTYTKDEVYKIYVDYTAKPEERKTGGSAAINEDKGLYFINPLGKDSAKPIQVWTQGETESNSCWFPTIDKPNQKCTDELYITHLKKYVSLSNGTLVSSVSVNDSLVTDYWKMDLPHAPYLVMMAIGDFAVVTDRWRDVPVNYYVEKDYAKYAKQIFGNTPQMMEFFSQRLGFDYPWPKYSQVVVRDYVSGAMENTSATLHGEFIQRNARELLDETFEDVISHELFHQWFGDLVTCESWSNTPLNESFATYGEYLWNEHKYGKEMADYKFYDNYEKYMQEAKDKNVDLIRFYYNDREDMFDRHSYEKGGLLLHYLRNIVGNEAFFKSLELYLKTNQFKPVEIQQLRLAFEEITGQDMNWFFNEWFLNSGHPVLDINYSYDKDSLYVTIEQKHNTQKELTYQLPFKIGMWYGKNYETHDVTLRKKSESFAFKTAGKPDLIDFDAERFVLCEKKENKTIGNYIFQYNNAPLFLQRLEALKKLAEEQKNNDTAKTVLLNAMNDKFFYLRQFAVKKYDLPKENNEAVLAVVEKLAKSDSFSSVRKEALEKLSKSTSAKNYAMLFQISTGDSSYEVAAAALKALTEVDSKKALAFAKQFEAEKNYNIAGAVADVYAKEGDSTYQSFFDRKLRSVGGFAKYYAFYYYANFLTRMEKPIVLNGLRTIEEEASSTQNHFLGGASKGAVKRIAKSFEDKKKKAQDDMSSEKNEKTKLELQEKISNCDTIIQTANDVLARLNKPAEQKKN